MSGAHVAGRHEGPAAGPAPMLLRGAHLVPIADDGGRTPSAPTDGPVDVRLVDGRIAEVGPALAAGPEEEVVDLAGRWLMPGLWDAHTHMDQWALARQRLDVSQARSAAEAAGMVCRRLTEQPVPEGAMLVAFGFRDGLWPDVPTAALLDEAIAAAGLPPTAVTAVSGDLHCGWLSSPALAQLGVADHPTGLMREAEWMPLTALLDAVPVEVLDAWVAEATRAAAARGVVGVVDLEIADNLVTWPRRAQAGPLALRVEAGVWPEHLDGVGGRPSGTPLTPDGLVTVGPFKVVTDGSLNTRTAFCHDPYPGLSGPLARGVLSVPPEVLVPLMTRAHAGGLRCAIHAIGDLANTLVLDAFESTGARGSVEHAQLLRPEDAPRMAALGLIASIQPEHAMDDRDVADRHWAGRTGHAFAFATLAQAGVTLALGSDAPVAALDPWVAIDAAVHRSRDGRDAWHPEQRLDLATAIAASVRGRVAVGEAADLVVLDADPTDPATDLREMPVTGTLLAGRWTHRTL